ncbi:MAG: nuclear transport factor 2 family protein, partial [Peptococcaceae bacterium]|nr:nuclear transport factor 2 family protein [Peptococcaceae bacterium]
MHHKYGYYIDKCLYDEAVDLFTDDCEVRFLGGIFKGKAGARRLYCDRFRERFTNGKNGPVYGFLLEHLQMQDIVD